MSAQLHEDKGDVEPAFESMPAYYQDNGFDSAQQMNDLHTPILNVANRYLAKNPGNVLDLGSGNGALLRKLVDANRGVVPHGMELDAKRHANTSKTLPLHTGNVLLADMFHDKTWPTTTNTLTVLAANRLLEGDPAKAKAFRDKFLARQKALLLYAYPDQIKKHGTLRNMATMAGLNLLGTDEGGTVGFARVGQQKQAEDEYLELYLEGEPTFCSLPSLEKKAEHVKYATYYEFAGPVQGAGLRETLHGVLDEEGVDGLLVNDARTGLTSGTIDADAATRQRILDRLRALQSAKAPKADGSSAGMDRGSYTVRERRQTVPMRSITMTDKDVLNMLKRQGFLDDLTDIEGYKKNITARFRLKPSAKGLTGYVPDLAYQQLRGEAPIYRSQISPETWERRGTGDDDRRGQPSWRTGLTTRAVSKADAKAVIDMLKGLDEKDQKLLALNYPAKLPSIRKALRKANHGRIAEVDGQLAGFAWDYPSMRSPGYGYLDTLVTHPNYRGQGVARRLVEDHLRSYPQTTAKTRSNNDNMKKLLPKMGFTPSGTTTDSLDNVSTGSIDWVRDNEKEAADFGDLSKIEQDQLLDFYIQSHASRRSGHHYDFRLGTPKMNLHSWALRNLPEPGQRRAAFRTPIHAYSYGRFEGNLTGPGAGVVKQHRRGKARVLGVAPNKISFSTIADDDYPEERYTLLKPSQFDQKTWLMLNNSTQTEENPLTIPE